MKNEDRKRELNEAELSGVSGGTGTNDQSILDTISGFLLSERCPCCRNIATLKLSSKAPVSVGEGIRSGTLYCEHCGKALSYEFNTTTQRLFVSW